MIPIKPEGVTWTDEQWEAIYEDNKNIIVSAGAGSGKTAVLTERVIRKLKDGIHINELLILTFTKAAAAEMADRIRKKIKKIPELKNELNLLDGAYITTFDSFALSVVKRYHYLINLSSDIGIIDSNVIDIKKNEIMEELFLEFYNKKEEKFLNMITNFCSKDDTEIKKYILNISDKLDLLSNKKEYLKNYLNNNFSIEKINGDIKKYVNLIKSKMNLIKGFIEEISYIDNEFSDKLNDSLDDLFAANLYNDIVSRINVKLPMAPRGSCDELKLLKNNISNTLKEIKELVRYKDECEIREVILSTYDTVSIIIDIILEFTNRVMAYKKDNNSYEFNDIAIMAIDILKSNSEVRDELFNSFNEIMVDEYQDTNDLQEEFISMISDHNVYMVGDIKQSIYRFRNANPNIFKNKYDSYSISKIDKKIDLNKNFRSREEVLNNINIIFSLIMNLDIGGADYIKDHQMIFGNKAYLKDSVEHSNDMVIYSYLYDKNLGYNKEEIEAFIIANDIKSKYSNHYKVFDKDSGNLRNARYSDFAIIIDRATSFDLYKKIFSYYGIPVTLLKDEKMNNSDDLNVIRNLIKLILLVKFNTINVEFKYLFVSILRSFLYNFDDNIIVDYFLNDNYKDSDLYKKCFNISKKTDYITISELLDIIEEEFDYYSKLITIGNINSSIVRLEKIKQMAVNLEKLGYTIEEFSHHLTELSSNNYSVDYKASEDDSESVKIMTIHKSKGLEYPICYFSGLYKSFNISDLKEKFLFDKEFGLIVPYFKEGIGQTIYKSLLKDKYLVDEISEKIRLFYVAVTRAREKIILIKPESSPASNTNRISVLSNDKKINYRSFMDMIDSIEFRINNYYKKIDLSLINLSHEYNMIKKENYKQNIKKVIAPLTVNEINVNNSSIIENSFSKKMIKKITLEEYNNINFGTKLHNILELFDFKNPNYDYIDNKLYKKIIDNFLKSDIAYNIKNAKIYKEYEFIYSDKNIKYHGIIDLMLEYHDHIDIIDYKLKNISDINYKEQLNGYKKYIEMKVNKPVDIYLYSLMDNSFSKID